MRFDMANSPHFGEAIDPPSPFGRLSSEFHSMIKEKGKNKTRIHPA
jgi:hypothetical protein